MGSHAIALGETLGSHKTKKLNPERVKLILISFPRFHRGLSHSVPLGLFWSEQKTSTVFSPNHCFLVPNSLRTPVNVTMKGETATQEVRKLKRSDFHTS